MSEDDTDKRLSVSAELSSKIVDILIELAKKRGVSANTVVEQAILNEQFFDKMNDEGSKVLVEKPDHTFLKVELAS